MIRRVGTGDDGRRLPYDHLPDAPEKLGGTMGRSGGRELSREARELARDYGESYGSDPAYSEYIRSE